MATHRLVHRSMLKSDFFGGGAVGQLLKRRKNWKQSDINDFDEIKASISF